MYWTQNNINVAERIEDGRTVLFKSEIQANKYASQVRSYPYPVVNSKRQIVGYGVPK